MSDDSEVDPSLKMLNARRMVELRKRASEMARQKEQEAKRSSKARAPTDRETILRVLVERGDEVFATAEASYPKEMTILIPKLADLIREKKINKVSGGELLQFLRSLGMRISVPTSISVEEHGKFVSLSDRLKQEE